MFAEEGSGHILTASGRHLRTIDLKSGITLYEFGYDENGSLVSITDRFGNETVIEHGPGGIPRAIVSPDGLRTELAIDARNHLARISHPDGGSYRFEYTDEGFATLKVQPSGNRFVHVYDAAGRLSGFQDEEGRDWAFSSSMLKEGDVSHETQTAEGLSTTQADRENATGAYQSILTDPAGTQSVVFESADGLTATMLQSCGNTADQMYDLDPQFKYKYLKKRSVKTPSGLKRETTLERTNTDADEDRIPDLIIEKVKVNDRIATRSQDVTAATQQIVSLEGRSVTLEYNPVTLAAERLKVPGLLDTSYTYDSRGRLAQAAVGTRSTSYAYDEKGFLAAVTDPQNRTTSFSHDAVGRVAAVVRPDQSRLEFAYDANGNLALLIKPSGVEHRFGHNRVNHRSSYTTPLSGSYIYKFDRDRRPAETVLPSGRVIRSVYDNGRLIRTETPEANIYFDYLCGSKLGSAVRGAEGIAYGYDGSLLVSDTRSGTLGQAISYAYDPYFELIESSYAGMEVSDGYDDDGLLTQAGAYAVSRDPGNGLAAAVSDGSFSLSRSFNGYGEIATQSVAVAGKGIAVFSLARDNAGRIVQKRQAAGGVAAAHTYQYDVMGRLLKVAKDGTLVEEYAYDENGTRIYEQNTLRGIAGRSYAYSDEDHLLTAGEWGYQYDLDGFLTSKTNQTNPTDKTSYSYSATGELLAVSLPDGRQIAYVHDPLGRRISKAVNNAIVEKYLWQGMTRLLAVFDGAGALLMRFEYADERMPVAMTAGGSRYYLAYDQVGSLIAVADAAGGVVKRVEYDSFGNIISDSNPGFAVPFGFAGGLHDRETGLLRFGYRAYDPEVGRWTAKDPIGFAGGDTDLYGYVLNDPVNWVDPYGLFNVTKMGVGYANSFRGILNIGAGVSAIAAGTATIPFAGKVVATPAYAIGGAKITTGFANFNRGLGQMREALDEPFDQSSLRNLLGLGPFGQKYDDPCEPGPLEYFKGIWHDFVVDPARVAKRAIVEFFAFD